MSTAAHALPAFVSVLGIVASGCLAPPALLPAFDVDLERVLPTFPAGTQRVEVTTDGGTRLRGLFVPAEAHAPVVLHLLESSGSVASARVPYAELCAEFLDLGFSSLLIDYSGIGISEGETSVDNLAGDARAMWAEALRRAGGDAARVLVRATSLGAIAAGLLLEEGARPAALVLIAPVLADSVVERFARDFHGRLAGWYASSAFREVAAVDLVEVIQSSKVPTLLLAGEDDTLLDDQDREELDRAAWGGGWGLYPRPGDHIRVSLESHAVLRDELPFLEAHVPCTQAIDPGPERLLAALPDEIAAQFPEGFAARTRLARFHTRCRAGDPRVLAAVALAHPNPLVAARWMWLQRMRPYPELAWEELVQALSLADPAGELPIDLIEDFSAPLDLVRRFGGGVRRMDSRDILIAAHARGYGPDGCSWRSGVTIGNNPTSWLASDHEALFLSLCARGLDAADARRQFVRVLLKAHRIPDRLTRDAQGALLLEVFEEGSWRLLDLDQRPDGEPSVGFGGYSPLL